MTGGANLEIMPPSEQPIMTTLKSQEPDMWYVHFADQSKSFASELQARLFAKSLRLKGHHVSVSYVEPLTADV